MKDPKKVLTWKMEELSTIAKQVDAMKISVALCDDAKEQDPRKILNDLAKKVDALKIAVNLCEEEGDRQPKPQTQPSNSESKLKAWP